LDDDNDNFIDEDELDGLDNDGDWNSSIDDLGSDGLPDSLESGCKGNYDPVINSDPAFDNYNPSSRNLCKPDGSGNFPYKNDKNTYTQNNGLPDHGEKHVDEDYGATSQSDFACSYTDTIPQPQNPTHLSQHIKGWQKSYAWEKGSAADAIIVFDYSFINLGTSTMEDVYLGMFADMDVGSILDGNYAQNNYSAFDRETRTAYVQNPVDIGSTPLGITLLGAHDP